MLHLFSLPLIALLVLCTTSCKSGSDDLGPPEFDTGMHVGEALTRSPGDTVTVNGWLIASRGSSRPPRICTALDRPREYVIDCLEPSMLVLMNLDEHPEVERFDATTWVGHPVQVSGKLVKAEGREMELDPYNCLEAFTNRCRLPEWHMSPSAAASSSATPIATTERRVVIPPPGGTSTATFRGIPVLFRIAIVDFFGMERVVTDEAEIEAVVPWPIVLPSYLPPEYDKIGCSRYTYRRQACRQMPKRDAYESRSGSRVDRRPPASCSLSVAAMWAPTARTR